MHDAAATDRTKDGAARAFRGDAMTTLTVRILADLQSMPTPEADKLREYLAACHTYGRILPLMFKAGRGSLSHAQLSPQPMGVRRVRASAPAVAALPPGGGA
jgi:hypothetical protein